MSLRLSFTRIMQICRLFSMRCLFAPEFTRPVLLLLFTVLAWTGGFGQQSPADTAGTDKVHIDAAEIGTGKIIENHEYRFLKGNVELSQDSTFFYGDSIRIIDDQQVSAFGNIIIQKGDSLEVFADTLFYDALTRLADLYGEVALIHGDQELWTTHLAYDMVLNVARYDRPAQLIDSATQLSSKHGVYWVDTEQALFQDSVVVINPDFTLQTDSLRYDAPNQTALFIAPTWIYQSDGSKIYCESGFYNFASQEAEFATNARYEKDDQRAEGDRILYDGAEKTITIAGQARYTEEGREASGDTIIYKDSTGDIRIAGNAFFHDAKTEAKSEVITYNKQTEKIGLLGSGKITRGSQTISALRMDQDQKTGLGLFEGNVVIYDSSAQTILVSDHVETREETGYLKAFGKYRPTLKSIVDSDTLYVTADTLHSYEVVDSVTGDTSRLLHGYYDVRIFRGTMQGLCNRLDYSSRDSIFRMLGDPVLWSDTTQFTADTIDLYMKNQALDQIYLRTKAFIVSSIINQFFDQISGRRILADVDSSTLKSMHVLGNAESVYYVRDDDQAFVGVNQVVSSEIFFLFQSGNLDKIRFNTKPTGHLTPMQKVNHDALRLDAFVWRDAERPRTLEDLY